MNRYRALNLIIGPLLFVMLVLLLPDIIFASQSSKMAVGTVAWMAYWWVTGPLDYAVTAFLPIALNALFQMTDMSSVIANYASETIILLLGASIITVSWEITGVDKRIALAFISLVGNSLRAQVVFWFLLSMLMSSVLPNAVVCATITPIAVSMLNFIGEGNIADSRVGSKILLTIAYATGLGGLASPLGGAMNLVTVEYLQNITGREYIYVSWVIRFLPIMLVLAVSNILFMLRDIKRTDVIQDIKQFSISEVDRSKRMNFEQISSLLLFIIATVLSFTRQFYQNIFPGLKPAYVFIICAILSFLIVSHDGNRIMRWKSVQTKLVWELIYIFAGGLALGTLINGSGAAEDIGNFVSELSLQGGVGTVFIIIALTLLLSDVTSNTATAAVAMPIVISIIQGIGGNPIPYIYIASVGVNLSYMLPTSIRAIPVGYGLSPKYMLKEGWKMSVMVIILMTVLCALLMRFWPAFQTT